MVAPLTLYLVRHGEVHNPDKVLYGRLPDFHLSTSGRGQASAAAQYLAKLDLAAIYSSPMERAQETAHIIAAAQQNLRTPVTDERINECLTPFEGESQAELDKIMFDIYTGNEPPYEHPRDLRRRLVDFVGSMREQHSDDTIVAVTHGDIVVTAFMWAKGRDENDIGRTRESKAYDGLLNLGLPEAYPATASISELVFSSDDPDEVPAYTYIKPY